MVILVDNRMWYVYILCMLWREGENYVMMLERGDGESDWEISTLSTLFIGDEDTR